MMRYGVVAEEYQEVGADLDLAGHGLLLAVISVVGWNHDPRNCD